MDRHLTFWEKQCDINTFNEWCGNYSIGWKKNTRNYIINNCYKSILDVGAGIFSEYYGFINDGYDINYNATEITEKFINFGNKNNIKVFNYPVQSMEFCDNSFDVITCYDVLNHQLDIETCLLELYRISKYEVIITFFKLFLEENPPDLINTNFKIEKNHKSGGKILHRVTDNLQQPTCIYHFFHKKYIIDVLKSNNIAFRFEKRDGREFLFLIKDKNKNET